MNNTLQDLKTAHVTNGLRPERRLAAAVLVQAVRDLRGGVDERRKSLRFFRDLESPFELFCHILDRDPKRTRSSVLALTDGPDEQSTASAV